MDASNRPSVDGCVIDDLKINKFSGKNFGEKEEIIKGDRPKPALDLNAKAVHCTRRFNVSLYERTLWLTGCSHLQKLFCWPCLLFSRELGPWNSGG